MKARYLALSALSLGLMSLGAIGSDTEASRSEPSAADFFLYSCAREYSKAHAFPLFDSSVSYAVEYSTIPPETLTRLYDAAKEFASRLRTPDLADPEHGGVAVLAQCLDESRSVRVRALIDTGPKE